MRCERDPERLVTRLTDGPVELDGTSPGWRAAVYANAIDGRQFLALYKGNTTSPEPILCRVHGGSTFADLFASTPKDGGHNLRATVAAIDADGRGIILYVPSRSRNDAESGPRFNHGPRWAEIDRMPVQLKEALVDLSRGFVV